MRDRFARLLTGLTIEEQEAYAWEQIQTEAGESLALLDAELEKGEDRVEELRKELEEWKEAGWRHKMSSAGCEQFSETGPEVLEKIRASVVADWDEQYTKVAELQRQNAELSETLRGAQDDAWENWGSVKRLKAENAKLLAGAEKAPHGVNCSAGVVQCGPNCPACQHAMQLMGSLPFTVEPRSVAVDTSIQHNWRKVSCNCWKADLIAKYGPTK
jgi:uncharacterized protein YhaN